AVGIVIKAARVGSFPRRFFPGRLETAGDGEIFNTLLGAQAACIGTVTADPQRFVQIRTGFGGRRMVDWLAGEQLPRIC
ncbi:hypothetical protein MX653_14680, partial [Thauera aromatica]|nr:hypothetical protein [Thauera aromatica]